MATHLGCFLVEFDVLQKRGRFANSGQFASALSETLRRTGRLAFVQIVTRRGKPMSFKRIKIPFVFLFGLSLLIGLSNCVAFATPVWQDPVAEQDGEPQTSAKQEMDELMNEFETKMSAFQTEYRTVSEEDRQKLIDEKMPKAADYAGRVMTLVKQDPDDPAVVDALSWVYTRGRGQPVSDEALGMLLKDHLDKQIFQEIVLYMAFRPPGLKIQDDIQRVIDGSPHESVKGVATYALAKFYSQVNQYKELLDDPRVAGNLSEEDLQYINEFQWGLDQQEALYQRLVDQYGDVEYRNRTLGQLAEGALFEIKYLSIGKRVPDISGDDLDGESFKLSDYLGKVVVLDFWGDW